MALEKEHDKEHGVIILDFVSLNSKTVLQKPDKVGLPQPRKDFWHPTSNTFDPQPPAGTPLWTVDELER